jgi:hypothetical protein
LAMRLGARGGGLGGGPAGALLLQRPRLFLRLRTWGRWGPVLLLCPGDGPQPQRGCAPHLMGVL